MNYLKIYNNLMKTMVDIKQERKALKKKGSYFERHHITPLSMGGDKSYAIGSDNIVLLTAREHYIAHRLLWLIYRTREMGFAFHKMVFSESPLQERRFDSRSYEAAKLALSQCQRGENNPMWGKEPWQKGKPLSEERKENQRKKMKGRYDGDKNPFYGKKHTKEFSDMIKNIPRKRGVENQSSRGWKILFDNGVLIGRFETLEEIVPIVESSIHNLKHHVRSHGKSKIKNRYILWYEEDYKKSLD